MLADGIVQIRSTHADQFRRRSAAHTEHRSRNRIQPQAFYRKRNLFDPDDRRRHIGKSAGRYGHADAAGLVQFLRKDRLHRRQTEQISRLAVNPDIAKGLPDDPESQRCSKIIPVPRSSEMRLEFHGMDILGRIKKIGIHEFGQKECRLPLAIRLSAGKDQIISLIILFERILLRGR